MTAPATTSAPGTRPRGPVDPRVLSLAPALRRHLLVVSALAALVAAAVLVQAEVLAQTIPELVQGDRSRAGRLVAALLLVALVRAATAAATDRSATAAVIATRRTVAHRVLDRVEHLRADRRGELGPARVAALTTTASDAIEPWIRSYVPGLPLAVALPIAAGLRILGADLTSALILAVVVPLVPIFMVLIGVATERQTAKQWDALQRLAGRFLDVISGLPTLRLFGRADAQVARVREVTDRYRTVTMRTLRVAFLSALVLELLATLSVALVAVALGGRLVHGDIDLETALVVLLLTPECLLPIRRVSAAFHAATAGVDAAAEIHEALDLPVRPRGRRAMPDGGPLVADGVTVAAGRRGSRLSATDLTLAAGRVVAITGPSGAGKSTLLDVLRGALPADEGSVALGGVAVGDLDPRALASAVRWVPQRARPLGSTVAASVALGHPAGPATDAAVDEAIERFGLGALRDAPPGDTSGGELRRIALARASVGVELGTVRFLLLDEPTAQLDPVAGRAVIDAALAARGVGVGVAIATHDPAVLAVADEHVAVLPNAPTDSDAPSPPAGPADDVPVHVHTDTALVPDPVAGWAAEVTSDLDDDGRGALRWLLGTARGQRRRLLAAGALGVLTDACTIGLAALAAWLIVRAAERPSFADLAVAAVGVRAFALGKGVLRYGERLTSHDATLRLLADLRATVIARLARLAPTGLPKGARGDLLARLVDDIDRMQDLFLRVLGPIGASLTVGVVAAAAAAALDPLGGLALLATVLLVGVGLPLVGHRAARRRGTLAAGLRGAIATDVVELADHAEELVAAGAAATWRDRIDEHADQLDAVDRAQGRWGAAIAAVAAAAPALATAAMVATLGRAGRPTGPELGVLVLLPLAVAELVAPLAAAGEALARVEASASRVLALLRRPDPVPEPTTPAPDPATGDLDLHEVAVAWPGAVPAVAAVELQVAPGERVAVVGPSGSGKSTIAAALVAFLAPVEGTYRVGGVDARALGGDGVRRQVTWCQQDPWFADSTLADNLRIADPTADDDALRDALRVAHLDAWLARLPDGLETRLARDASAMSGGERQRLALARALLGGQRAIVLDEPTAHLDEATAAAVLHDLLAATANRAVVLIAHDAAAEAGERRYELVPGQPGEPARWRAVTI